MASKNYKTGRRGRYSPRRSWFRRHVRKGALIQLSVYLGILLIIAAVFFIHLQIHKPQSPGTGNAANPGTGYAADQVAGRTDGTGTGYAGDPAAGQAANPAAGQAAGLAGNLAELPFREDEASQGIAAFSPGSIPDYAGQDYIELYNGRPAFTPYDLAQITGEHYSGLDSLGRCGAAWGLLDRSMMPRVERGDIGMVSPTGWQNVKYPELIEDGFLYNRCHLIAYALTGQNENERNLITGTRHLNTEGMLPFELQVMQYLDRSENHVLYRVTPYFKEYELVARGVEMEAYSVEDQGAGLCFHVFVYNVQPGIEIDYHSGYSKKAE